MLSARASVATTLAQRRPRLSTGTGTTEPPPDPVARDVADVVQARGEDIAGPSCREALLNASDLGREVAGPAHEDGARVGSEEAVAHVRDAGRVVDLAVVGVFGRVDEFTVPEAAAQVPDPRVVDVQPPVAFFEENPELDRGA